MRLPAIWYWLRPEPFRPVLETICVYLVAISCHLRPILKTLHLKIYSKIFTYPPKPPFFLEAARPDPEVEAPFLSLAPPGSKRYR